MPKSKIEISKKKFDINLKFYVFLKYLVKVSLTDNQTKELLKKIFLYKKAMIPLLHLTEQTVYPQVLTEGLSYDNDTCIEIATFTDSVNSLLKRMNENPSQETNSLGHSEQLATLINESNNLSNGIINYAQLLKDSYREAEIGGEETEISGYCG